MKNNLFKTYLTIQLGLLLIVSSSVKAQSLKTYSGSYQLGYTNGTATYTYKEKDYKQTKHGNFVWKNSRSYRRDYGNETLKGSFNDGKVNGSWTHTTDMKQNGVTSKITATGNFKDGMPNGLFEFKASSNDGTASATINASVNYKMGQMVGNVYYKSSPNIGDQSITGELNSNGFVIGEFKVHKKTYDDILRTSSKGVLEMVVSRNNGIVTNNKNYKEKLIGLSESDIYYETIQMPNEWYVYIMDIIWGESAFYNLKFEGVPSSDKLNGPKYLVGSQKGGLEESELTPVAVWETYLEKLNNENCISKSVSLHNKILLLSLTEKDKFEKSRDQILSAEVKLRDSVIVADTLFIKDIGAYFQSLRNLRKDYESSTKITESQLSTFAKIENEVLELAKLKIGDTPLNKIRLDDSVSSVLNGIKSFSETLNSINCPSLEATRDTSQACQVKVSPNSIGSLIDDLKSSIKKISSYKDNNTESLLKAYNAISIDEVKALNEKYAFYVKTEGMRTAKFIENYKAIFSKAFTNVNGPTFAEVIGEGLPIIKKFNENIDKSLAKLEKQNSELSAKFVTINAKQEVSDKYNEVINSGFNKPSNDIADFNTELDKISEYQSMLLSKILKFESQEKLIQSKIEESKKIAAITIKLALVYDSWWLNEAHKNADLETNFDELISLQGKLIKLFENMELTKSVAKELKKVEDVSTILQILNR